MAPIKSCFFIFFLMHCVESTRYGGDSEYCVDQTLAEKDRKGLVIWCRDSSDCSKGWQCVPANRFHFTTPINYCCQTRESICSLPPNPGYGDCMIEPATKYYFDSSEQICKSFKVITCHGRNNQNQFETHDQCVRFCQSTACISGESLLLSMNNSPQSCAEEPCPNGYRCVYDQLFKKNVCCGHSTSGVCPMNTVSFASIRTSLPMKCAPSNIRDECPVDYVCTTQGTSSYCCSPQESVCPLGQKAYIHAVSKNSMKCDPQIPFSCPSNYYCSPAVPGALWGFCCNQNVDAKCPSGTQPYLNKFTRTPQRCTVGVSQCGMGFTCQSMQKGVIIGFAAPTCGKRQIREC